MGQDSSPSFVPGVSGAPSCGQRAGCWGGPGCCSCQVRGGAGERPSPAVKIWLSPDTLKGGLAVYLHHRHSVLLPVLHLRFQRGRSITESLPQFPPPIHPALVSLREQTSHSMRGTPVLGTAPPSSSWAARELGSAKLLGVHWWPRWLLPGGTSSSYPPLSWYTPFFLPRAPKMHQNVCNAHSTASLRMHLSSLAHVGDICFLPCYDLAATTNSHSLGGSNKKHLFLTVLEDASSR